jgi:hypothetical protein
MGLVIGNMQNVYFSLTQRYPDIVLQAHGWRANLSRGLLHSRKHSLLLFMVCSHPTQFVCMANLMVACLGYGLPESNVQNTPCTNKGNPEIRNHNADIKVFQFEN